MENSHPVQMYEEGTDGGHEKYVRAIVILECQMKQRNERGPKNEGHGQVQKCEEGCAAEKRCLYITWNGTLPALQSTVARRERHRFLFSNSREGHRAEVEIRE